MLEKQGNFRPVNAGDIDGQYLMRVWQIGLGYCQVLCRATGEGVGELRQGLRNGMSSLILRHNTWWESFIIFKLLSEKIGAVAL